MNVMKQAEADRVSNIRAHASGQNISNDRSPEGMLGNILLSGSQKLISRPRGLPEHPGLEEKIGNPGKLSVF
jgi:hypothetical protein